MLLSSSSSGTTPRTLGDVVYAGVTGTSSGAKQIVLPTAACDDALDDGRIYIVKDEDDASDATGNNITINTEGTETIDNVVDPTSLVINTQLGVARLICADGANGLWFTW